MSDRYYDYQAKLDHIEAVASRLRETIANGYGPSDVVMDNIDDAFNSISIADERQAEDVA